MTACCDRSDYSPHRSWCYTEQVVQMLAAWVVSIGAIVLLTGGFIDGYLWIVSLGRSLFIVGAVALIVYVLKPEVFGGKP